MDGGGLEVKDRKGGKGWGVLQMADKRSVVSSWSVLVSSSPCLPEDCLRYPQTWVKPTDCLTRASGSSLYHSATIVLVPFSAPPSLVIFIAGSLVRPSASDLWPHSLLTGFYVQGHSNISHQIIQYSCISQNPSCFVWPAIIHPSILSKPVFYFPARTF